MDQLASKTTYLLYKPFTMPLYDQSKLLSYSHSIPAIAVSSIVGKYITSLYAILITMIFATLWNLLVEIAFMLPYPASKKVHEDLNEKAITKLCSATSSPADYKTSWLIFPITRTPYKGDPENGRSQDLFITNFSAFFIFLATALYVGRKVVGTFLPAQLSIGKVAPVNAT
ncbi:hypothetical protein RUND412_010349 [Rhizina undulata]